MAAMYLQHLMPTITKTIHMQIPFHILMSDDYGLSVSKSHSSEDPISLTQFHPLHGRDYGNSKVSLSRK